MLDGYAISSADDLLAAQKKVAYQDSGRTTNLYEQQNRIAFIKEYAFSTAIREGIKSRLAEFKSTLKKEERNLDAIYNFAPLMIQDKVIPPVITENVESYNLEDDNTIKTSDRIYQIKSQARFSSVSPNWRAYFDLPIEDEVYNYSKLSISKQMLPQNSYEEDVWKSATIEGWDEGVKQANQMMQNNFARLNRDYTGMVRFHQFVLEGKVSMPALSEYNLENANTGNIMVLNQQLFKINQLPQFQNGWIRNPESRGFSNTGNVLTPNNKPLDISNNISSSGGEVEEILLTTKVEDYKDSSINENEQNHSLETTVLNSNRADSKLLSQSNETLDFSINGIATREQIRSNKSNFIENILLGTPIESIGKSIFMFDRESSESKDDTSLFDDGNFVSSINNEVNNNYYALMSALNDDIIKHRKYEITIAQNMQEIGMTDAKKNNYAFKAIRQFTNIDNSTTFTDEGYSDFDYIPFTSEDYTSSNSVDSELVELKENLIDDIYQLELISTSNLQSLENSIDFNNRFVF